MTRRRPSCTDDAAVSNVVGAILLFALFTITLITIQVEFVPVWDKQRERDASLEVAGQMGAIKADLDRIAANQTETALAEPISLSRERGFSFFGSNVLPGEARFTPVAGGAGMTVSSANPVALTKAGGQDLAELSEDWTWTGANIPDILGIQHLRMRIPSPNGLPTGTQTLTFTVTDAASNCVGKATLVATGTTLTTKAIEARVFPALTPAAASCGATAIDIETTYIGTAAPTYYYHDFMASGPLRAVLAAVPSGQYPLQASFTQGNTGGQVAMIYDQSTAFGTVRSGSSGLVFPSLNQAYTSGDLSVSLNHQRLERQVYSFEYGAVFLDQELGAAMAAPPGFSVSTAAAQAGLSWAFPLLTGGSSAVTGAPAATLTMIPNGGSSLGLSAQDITVTLTTDHPAQWAAFWDERLVLAGLTSSPATPSAPCTVLTASPQYTITTTATSATLVFFGPCSAPGDATRDILLDIVAGGASVELRPAG
ncbi:MAG TPA: hypothetical protein VI796_01260 [Candidatus Thermoplasmatota archaeon]|nr:hypothetical protein [Candidatus Thermoplasmatota archaeon]